MVQRSVFRDGAQSILPQPLRQAEGSVIEHDGGQNFDHPRPMFDQPQDRAAQHTPKSRQHEACPPWQLQQQSAAHGGKSAQRKLARRAEMQEPCLPGTANGQSRQHQQRPKQHRP